MIAPRYRRGQPTEVLLRAMISGFQSYYHRGDLIGVYTVGGSGTRNFHGLGSGVEERVNVGKLMEEFGISFEAHSLAQPDPDAYSSNVWRPRRVTTVARDVRIRDPDYSGTVVIYENASETGRGISGGIIWALENHKELDIARVVILVERDETGVAHVAGDNMGVKYRGFEDFLISRAPEIHSKLSKPIETNGVFGTGLASKKIGENVARRFAFEPGSDSAKKLTYLSLLAEPPYHLGLAEWNKATLFKEGDSVEE